MSTHKIVPAALVAGFALIALPVAAKPTAKPKVKTPTAHATTVKPSTTHGPKTAPTVKTHGAATTTHGPATKVKTQGASTTMHASKGQAKAVKPTQTTTSKGQAKTKGSTKASTSDKTMGPGSATMGPGTGTMGPGNGTMGPGNGTTADTTPTTTKLSKAQQQLMKNDHLRLKMLDRLPPNTKVIPAAAGFKNLGQFIAAVNVSHNQGIDFFALKALMVGPDSMSLGQALQQVKGMDPTTARRVADKATATAEVDLDRTSGATTVTTTRHQGHH